MLTIALTGGIGSGKTKVTEIFQELASTNNSPAILKVIDADTIARQLLSGSLNSDKSTSTNSHHTLKAVYQLFGADVFDSLGQLNRKMLRSVIFSSSKKKQQLEELLHPIIYQEITSQIIRISQYKPDNTIIIISIPLLFETHNNYHFDRVLVIDVPIKLQIKRSSTRDQCSSSLIKKIIHSQVDRETRLSRADDIIDNSGSLIDLNKQVKSLFQYYCLLL